jgi:hypothetical protein
MIPQRNISLISNTLMTAGGRRIPEAVIERDYVLAWFLTGLADHSLREVLAFKGGTALRRCWFEDYRFSEDLHFTLIRPIAFDEILAGFAEIYTAVEAACGLRIAFDREDRHGHQNSHTFYLSYQGPLPAPNDVKVDITINEVLCFPLPDRPIHRIYDGFDDLPEGPTPPRQNSCRLHRTKNPGAAMKDESGSIRTSIQRPSGSEVAAAGEFGAGGGGARSWHWSGNTGALARGCAVQARPRAGLDCARPA